MPIFVGHNGLTLRLLGDRQRVGRIERDLCDKRVVAPAAGQGESAKGSADAEITDDETLSCSVHRDGASANSCERSGARRAKSVWTLAGWHESSSRTLSCVGLD